MRLMVLWFEMRTVRAVGDGIDPSHTLERDTTDTNLSSRALRQTTAYGLLRIASSLSTWVAFVVLSRILQQRDFGVFEIGQFYIGLGALIGDGGLAASLIRRPGEERRSEFQVAFTTALFFALTMALAFELSISQLRSLHTLTSSESWAVRCMGLCFVLPVLRMVPYVRLERRIDYAAIGRIELAANLVRHATAIAVAMFAGGVWALLASALTQSVCQIALAYRAAPGWVGLGFRRAEFKSLFAYGSKVQAGSLGLYLKDNLAGGLLGPWLGPAAVGVFRFGQQFVRVPADTVNGLARVQFPVYAQLSLDRPELFAMLRGALRSALLLGVPVLGALCFGASWIVPAIYGDKWTVTFPIIWALAPYVVGDLLTMQLITFFQAQGRAGFALKIYLAWAALLWGGGAAALLLAPNSLAMVAAAYSAGTLAIAGVLLHAAGVLLRRSLWPAVLPPLTATAIACAGTHLIGDALHVIFPNGSSFGAAVVSIGTFALLFTACLRLFEGDAALRDFRAATRILRGRGE